MTGEPAALVELKPCPFCEGHAYNVHKAGDAWFVDADHTPECHFADFQRTGADAIAAWNRRPDALDLLSAGRQGGDGTAQSQPIDYNDLEDEIADALQDSLDMDWTSRDGARAVVRFLKERR